MQEDKEAIFDAVDTLRMCLTAFIPMVDTMKVLPEICAMPQHVDLLMPQTVQITW